MNKIICLFLLILSGMALYAFEPFFAKDAAISPDGEQVCFVYLDDLWLVPFKGGDAKRLTSTEAKEWSPVWSPDGSTIAFISNREGQAFPYLIPSGGGIATVVIRESYGVSDWFSDGKHLLGNKSSFGFGSSLFKIPLDGSRPTLIAEMGNPFASLSPDNTKIIFNHRGDAYRESYLGSINGELWEIDLGTKQYTKLTNTPFTERYPRYAHFSNSIFYCASDGKSFQLNRVENGDFSKPFKLSSFDPWSARDISIARQNDRIVFERFDEIWKFDTSKIGAARLSKLEINIPQDIWDENTIFSEVKNDAYIYAVSDDDLLTLFRHKYDIFAMPKKGGDVKQISFDHAGCEAMEFLSDGRTAILNRLYQGINSLFRVKVDSLMTLEAIEWFGKGKYHVDSIGRDEKNRWVINYTDDRRAGNIAVADSLFANIQPMEIPGYVSSGFSISPDGRYALYSTLREDIWMRELFLYEFDTKSSTKILNDENGIGWIHWMPDMKSVLLSRGGNIFRLDFVPRDEFEFETDHWKKVFEPIAPTEKKKPKKDDPEKEDDSKKDTSEESEKTEVEPIPKAIPRFEIQWLDIDKRFYPVVTDATHFLSVLKVIDDSTFFYIQDGYFGDSNSSIKKTDIYGKTTKEEVNLGKHAEQFRLVGDNVYYLENGVIKSYHLKTKSRSEVKISFDYKFDRQTLNRRVFEQVWGAFGLNFYDRNMHDQNWQKIYKLYLPYIDKAKSINDIEMIVNEMIGDVNASHTGFYPREDKPYPSKQLASLGVELDYYSVLESGIRIHKAYPRSRLYNLYGVRDGDIITHIDGTKITAKTPIDSLLSEKIGKRINLKILQNGVTVDAKIEGISRRLQYDLFYQDKNDRNRSMVDKLSGGRLGYVHIPAMGSKDYEVFIRDVFRDNADKEGIVIDVRGNSGGRIHDMIVSFLQRKHYALSTSRRISVDKQLEPRRIWNRPSIVLVDERSFSDGEIFPVIYQELKLGKVVGMPSSGSVIGTWEYDLIDGSSMRMPGSGWYKLDGTNMEGTGAMPDILQDISPNDLISKRDPQLERAVTELLSELKP